MKNFRWMILSPIVGMLFACSSIHHTAPIVDRTTGVKPASMFAGKPGYYIVKRGDTLSAIGRMHKQKPADIIAWNNLSNPNDIKVDQVLRVAPPGAPDAFAEAQADSISSGAVEVRPLGGATTASAVSMHKTSPRGDKQPYSDGALAAMQKSVQAVPVAPAMSGMAAKPAVQSAQPVAEAPLSWKWPTEGKVSARFNEGKSRGIDIAGKMGQKIHAAAAGRVIHVGPLRGYGNMVIVKHDENIISVYAHNRNILVKQGDAVSQGQPISEMGNSDSATVKLHFEVRRQGKPVDPTQFLPPR